MTSGESSNEDVDAPVVALVVLEIGGHDFETFLVADSDLRYVEQWVGDVSEEIGCIVDCMGGWFVKIFAEFSPEDVEHEFGSGFASRIFRDESWIEVDVFFLSVLLNVACFGFGCSGPSGVPCRFLLDFKPCVHLICEESFDALLWWETPDIVDFDDAVSYFDGFDEFWCAPVTAQLSLLGSVGTTI